MGKLNKFENVDVTASLEAIMKQNTAFYQSDFDIDKEIMKRAAESPNAGDKMLLWFSRPSGTCCIKERNAFLKDTREHNTWKFYGEQTRDRVLAYAVELTGIQDGLIETEARRIVGKMKELSDPNSPDKSHFMVELSPYFTQIATTKDTDRLFSMLPYKTLSFSQIKDRHGTYALIGKDENRDREIRKPRPSVRAQLAQEKKRTAPKKAAAKAKDHGMEV